ncbi:MAG: hypothetical protein A4E63_02644 [Syntrophorhabdus sp. PtaU1.Bin050]|nr:MAG: hypothetical protein A4E63_02644 [Syntrophorhabdus sp. PtaU1.Bin050]
MKGCDHNRSGTGLLLCLRRKPLHEGLPQYIGTHETPEDRTFEGFAFKPALHCSGKRLEGHREDYAGGTPFQETGCSFPCTSGNIPLRIIRREIEYLGFFAIEDTLDYKNSIKTAF